jgi:hypothetical protein
MIFNSYATQSYSQYRLKKWITGGERCNLFLFLNHLQRVRSPSSWRSQGSGHSNLHKSDRIAIGKYELKRWEQKQKNIK